MTYNRWTQEYTRPTFGIEQEFYIKRSADAYVRNDPIGVLKRELGSAGMGWIKVIRDGTPNVDAELVFPPAVDTDTFWDDYSKAMEICVNLGFGYREQCGMHVHIGTRRTKPALDLSEFWMASKVRATNGTFKPDDNLLTGVDGLMSFHLVKDIVRFYGANQTFIDNAMPASRANQSGDSMISSMAWVVGDRSFENATDLADLERVIRNHNSRSGGRGWNSSVKFNAVNVGCYENGTIEFRQHPATLSTQKARDWVRLLINAIEVSDCYRLASGSDVTTTADETVNTPDCPYRHSSNIGMLYRACRIEGGATVRQLMNITGMGADNIRARISEIRNAIGQDAVITYTQQQYNHRYGASGGNHDLGGYEIQREYTRTVAAPQADVIIRDDAPAEIIHNLSYQVARNFMQGPVTRLRH